MTLGLTCCFIHTNFPLDLLSKILNQFSESVLHTVHTSRQFSLWLLFTYITFTKFMPAISLSFFLFLPLFPSFLFLFSLWPHLQHMEVPRPGIKSELQLPAYTTATATWIWATSMTYTTAFGNAGFLTCWANSGIEPASSGTLCCVLNLLSHNWNSYVCHFWSVFLSPIQSKISSISFTSAEKLSSVIYLKCVSTLLRYYWHPAFVSFKVCSVTCMSSEMITAKSYLNASTSSCNHHLL